MAAMTSSLTPLALAPGVLNTTMPRSLHLSMGMLFTPAPARAIPLSEAGSSSACRSALRTRIPSGFRISDAISKESRGSSSSPMAAILLSVWILNMLFASR